MQILISAARHAEKRLGRLFSDGATGQFQRGNRGMAYDGLDRLTSTVSPMFGTATYGHDVLDNLTRVAVTGGPNPRDHWYTYDGSNPPESKPAISPMPSLSSWINLWLTLWSVSRLAALTVHGG